MPTVKLTSYEMQMLKEAALEAQRQHDTTSRTDKIWNSREGKALDSAVKKMADARKAEVEAVMRKVKLG